MLLSIGEITIVIVVSVVLMLLSYFLYKSIKKEEIRFQTENLKGLEDIVDKNELIHQISNYISRNGTMNRFYLLKIRICDLESFYEKKKKHIGNEILKDFIKQVKRSMKSATIARDKFNEFYIWYTDYLELDKLRIIIDDFVYNLDLPLEVGDDLINVKYIISLVAFPQHNNTIKGLLDNLELAFFVAQKSSESYIIFDHSLEEIELDNQKINIELKDGIRNNEFEFYFQPICNTLENRIDFAECLIRWNHPELGLLTPNKFMNVFESSGNISWLTYWGIEELFKKSNELNEGRSNKIILNMNLSINQIILEDLISNVNRLVRKYKVDPKDFCFEIVEFTVLQRNNLMLENITKLRELGFKIAIDDLGLEFNTLTKLEKLPIDIIKLDDKFIEETKNNFMKSKISEMLLEFASNNGVLMVAEAIEHKESVEYINGKGINLIQGYLISKPLKFNDLKNFVENKTFFE